VRNDLSGQVLGNVYLLHDEPVTPAEAVEFDKTYLQLLAQSIEHPTKVIREVAEIAWNEFAADPDVGQRLPSRLDIIESRMNSQSWTKAQAPAALQAPEFGIRTQQNMAQSPLSSATELSKNDGERIAFEPSSESELSRKSLGSDSVRRPNSYSTYTDTNKNVCKRSVHVPLTSNDIAADLLEALHRLPVDQKQNALVALQKIPADMKPALIKQWVHRCDTGGIRNPLGYLMTLVGMAVRGEFNSQWNPDDKAKASPGDQVASNPLNSASQPTKAVALARSPESIQTAKHTLSGMLHLLKPNRGTHP
jgi:hypothetical protein